MLIRQGLRLAQRGWRPVSTLAASFPLIQGTSNGATAGGTTENINLPASIQVGEMLMAFVSVGGGALSVPAGWTQAYTVVSSVVQRQSMFYKVADGSEGSTLAVTGSNSNVKSYGVFRASDYRGVPEAVTASGSSGDADPPNLAPSWGADKTLWLAAARGFLNGGDPAGYGDTVAPGSSFRIARKELQAASDDPAVFTTGTSTNWSAATVALRGL